MTSYLVLIQLPRDYNLEKRAELLGKFTHKKFRVRLGGENEDPVSLRFTEGSMQPGALILSAVSVYNEEVTVTSIKRIIRIKARRNMRTSVQKIIGIDVIGNMNI